MMDSPLVGQDKAALEMRHVVKHFNRNTRSQKRIGIKAVDGVDLELAPGLTLGLVGESGSGKSTLGKLAVGLETPDSGSVSIFGQPIVGLSKAALKTLRTRVQLVFQNPYSSLNPKMSVDSLIREPLVVHRRSFSDDRVPELLEMVGLTDEHRLRRPNELSGGQLQRVAIARALSLQPDLLVLDEPVSALDVSIQAQILNLLRDLQSRLGLSYLFISHDLDVVRAVSDRVAVMYLGRIVEVGDTESVLASPRHPYTQALISSVPVSHPEMRGGERRVLETEPPSQVEVPTGCRFQGRCWQDIDVCLTHDPKLEPMMDSSQVVACHVATDNNVTTDKERQ